MKMTVPGTSLQADDVQAVLVLVEDVAAAVRSHAEGLDDAGAVVDGPHHARLLAPET